jgi:hypothetical protein
MDCVIDTMIRQAVATGQRDRPPLAFHSPRESARRWSMTTLSIATGATMDWTDRMARSLPVPSGTLSASLALATL